MELDELREFALRMEHELHLHTTDEAGRCEACGERWPCMPILAAARALDVKVPADDPATLYWAAANDPNRTPEKFAAARTAYAAARRPRGDAS